MPRQRATRGRVPPHEPGATAYVHRTDSLDYAYVIDGAIYSVLDSGETLMRPGDVLIQRGTNHAWDNRSDKPCTILFALLSATPSTPEPSPRLNQPAKYPNAINPLAPLDVVRCHAANRVPPPPDSFAAAFRADVDNGADESPTKSRFPRRPCSRGNRGNTRKGPRPIPGRRFAAVWPVSAPRGVDRDMIRPGPNKAVSGRLHAPGVRLGRARRRHRRPGP
ncbi:cupin domain-containing protein [Actinomadura yumaensis]|uniref:cupin domain-containing protein n=1 Tax=Actinomadura yumaensis TaxID=111807 RepID=UPI00360B8181